jgi:hypothetical protein
VLKQSAPHCHVASIETSANAIVTRGFHAAGPAHVLWTGINSQWHIRSVAKLNAPTPQYEFLIAAIMAQQVVDVLRVQPAIIVSKYEQIAASFAKCQVLCAREPGSRFSEYSHGDRSACRP